MNVIQGLILAAEACVADWDLRLEDASGNLERLSVALTEFKQSEAKGEDGSSAP